ncbi:hypothetical protein T439DRAFT_356369 [Meredithblackwellia eburnea MCA 4105]
MPNKRAQAGDSAELFYERKIWGTPVLFILFMLPVPLNASLSVFQMINSSLQAYSADLRLWSFFTSLSKLRLVARFALDNKVAVVIYCGLVIFQVQRIRSSQTDDIALRRIFTTPLWIKIVLDWEYHLLTVMEVSVRWFHPICAFGTHPTVLAYFWILSKSLVLMKVFQMAWYVIIVQL